MKVGLVVHVGRAQSVELAVAAAEYLAGEGVEVVVAHFRGVDEIDTAALERIATAREPGEFATGLDLAISFGGDGTFLRAAHLCRAEQVPVLGVNLGRLGFLAEVEAEDLDAALAVIVGGGYAVEERATLDVSVVDASGTVHHRGWALNEVALEKTVRQRLLSVEVSIDETVLQRVSADAIVVATPTGSTAYALSAGGPIVSPRLAATLIVPVAPHSLFDRTVIAGPQETVRVELLEGELPAIVSSDGRDPVRLQPGGHILARGGGSPVRIARTHEPDFYRLLRDKFGLR